VDLKADTKLQPNTTTQKPKSPAIHSAGLFALCAQTQGGLGLQQVVETLRL